MKPVRGRRWAAHAVLIVLSGAAASEAAELGAENDRVPRVEANDNRRAAGRLEGDTLKLSLRAAVGRWQPEGPTGPALQIETFGEIGRALSVPAPLIRVVEGTRIVVSIRNDLATTLVVHGLCERGGGSCTPLRILPQQTGEVGFRSGPAGTYHYWASAIGAPMPFRELGGALVVDRAGMPAEPDRIMVITEWSDLTPQQLGQIVSADVPTEAFVALKPRLTFVINGLSWPATERFTYELGCPVRWRVINLSSQPHSMHLHGFYFDVNSLGDGARDSAFDDASRRRVVTQLLAPGGTMTMTWTPERAGNWLFHCHIMHHVSLDRRLPWDGGQMPQHAAAHRDGGHATDASAGMAGMVIGVTVRDSAAAATAPASAGTARRKLTLVMKPVSGQGRHQDSASAGFVLREDAGPAGSQDAVAPGPPIVLRREEPVEITLVNQLDEGTAIHWHGIELESYYDGVHNWSGLGRRVTPMIEPGDSFVVRFTPPRAGTFIYHTHLHDYRQLSSGLYGPVIVLDGEERFDAETDHVIVLGRTGLTSAEPSVLTEPDSMVINGDRSPRFVWKAGTRHRVRLINITPDDIFNVTLQTSEGPVVWRRVAKDGAPVPMTERDPCPARQTIAVGETYDFEFEAPPRRSALWLEVRTPGGKWQAQARVIIR